MVLKENLSSWLKSIRPTATPFVEFALVLSLVVAIQFQQGAYDRDVATHPDEAAHFVTGVMVHDYLSSGLAEKPMPFAEDYYQRYPKVALGHWPPGFYAMQAVWYLVFGVSKWAATLLVGTIAAALIWCLFHEMSRQHSTVVALLALAVFVGQPLVRNHCMLIMADMAACLATVLAVFAFCRFLVSQSLLHIGCFAIWSIVAILTRPSAMALALFVPLCLLITGRFSVLKNWRLWMGGLTIAIMTAPWYCWTWNSGMGLHSHGNVETMISRTIHSNADYGVRASLSSSLSWWLVAISLLGAIAAFFDATPRSPDQDKAKFDAKGAIALCLATVGFIFLSPISSGPRYFLPALAGATILFAYGLSSVVFLGDRLIRNGRIAKGISWLAACGLSILTINDAPGAIERRVTGYSIAADVFAEPKHQHVILISSHSPGAGSIGEGAFIVERLLRDRKRSDYVFRASKILSESNWSNSRYRLKFATREQVDDFLKTTPVHFIVIDDYLSDESPPHHQLLKDAVKASSRDFSLVAQSEVTYTGNGSAGSIRVYKNLSVPDLPSGNLLLGNLPSQISSQKPQGPRRHSSVPTHQDPEPTTTAQLNPN